MAYSIKSSLLGWWFLLIMAIFLWYRNYKYDRIMAAVAIILGLFQLIEYGIFNNMDRHQGGKLIFSILWLLLLILAMSTLIFVKNTLALAWLVIIATVFLFAIIYAFISDGSNFGVDRSENYLIWTREGRGILHGLEWLYIMGIIVPVILLFNYYKWEELGLYVIIMYIIISFLVIWYLFDSSVFGRVWVYSLVGIIMIAWFIGIFNP